MWHHPHDIFYNPHTCLRMSTLCEWPQSLNFNFAICIYLASSAILSWPNWSGPIKTCNSHMLHVHNNVSIRMHSMFRHHHEWCFYEYGIFSNKAWLHGQPDIAGNNLNQLFFLRNEEHFKQTWVWIERDTFHIIWL